MKIFIINHTGHVRLSQAKYFLQLWKSEFELKNKSKAYFLEHILVDINLILPAALLPTG